MKRPPAPENIARMTGCRARMFFLKARPASAYRSNIDVLSCRIFLVATSPALDVEAPTISCKYVGSSAPRAGEPDPTKTSDDRSEQAPPITIATVLMNVTQDTRITCGD